MSNDELIMQFVAYFVVAYLFAAGLSLLVESPFINLEKEFLRKRNSSDPKKVKENKRTNSRTSSDFGGSGFNSLTKDQTTIQ